MTSVTNFVFIGLKILMQRIGHLGQVATCMESLLLVLFTIMQRQVLKTTRAHLVYGSHFPADTKYLIFCNLRTQIENIS